jgi:spore germination protein
MNAVHAGREITMIQAAAIVCSSIIGVGILPLPLFAVRAADSGAPLVTLLGFSLAALSVFLLGLLGMRFPNQTLMEYSEQLIGKWPAKIGGVLLAVFFILLTSLAAREFGEIVVTSVLRRTPLEVTVIVMLLLAAVSARKNITVFAYIHYFYFPVIVGPALLIVILSLKNAEFLNLQPWTGNEPNGMPLGVLTVAALFQSAFVLNLIGPAMRQPNKLLRAGLLGILIAGVLYILIVAASVAVFGSEETRRLVWPTLELARMTSLPANVLERLDAAFLAVWVTAVFTTLLSTYYIVMHKLSKLFGVKDHRVFALFLLPYVFIIAMLPPNIQRMYGIIQFVGRIGLILTILYPALLWLTALLRKKGGRSGGNASSNG